MKVEIKNSKRYKLSGIINKTRSKSIVIFSHGLNSGKHSSRNIAISDKLVKEGISTFLIDFTGHGESEGTIDEATIEQMADDLNAAIDYAAKDFDKIGISGSSLGGTVAIVSASKDKRIKTMILRAPPSEGYYAYAKKIKIPVMILQGGEDVTILAESQKLIDSLSGEKKLEIIEGASHLFDGYIEEMVEKTVEWFVKYLK